MTAGADPLLVCFRPPFCFTGRPGPSSTHNRMNLANQVTVSRFLLSLVYFALLAVTSAADGTPLALLDTSFILFLIAAGTDFLDGYLARRQNTVTSFGRVADPFVDKILVCGSFVFLAAAPRTAPLLPAWMVVAILVREFVVHEVRTRVEARGRAFGASIWGKMKMVFQCFAIGGLLLYWGRWHDERWLEPVTRALVWVQLVSTLASGALYAWAARDALRRPPPGANTP
jgi:CDP-diacylglycerol--glycerol-3-phosphate 3-phosphatidyltransferase